MVEAGTACIQEVAVSQDACRAQVARIVQSADFDATVRERRFLQYVVDETLAGRAVRIKAYSIATEVFGRNDSFDPQNDPIVRIEAGRLRRALERYYLTAGIADTLVITIPKGGYVPVFSWREPEPAKEPAAGDADDVSAAPPASSGRSLRRYGAIAATLIGLGVVIAAMALYLPERSLTQSAQLSAPEPPRLMVKAFEAVGDTQASVDIAVGLTNEVTGQLSRFKDITVLLAEVEKATPARYELQGSVSVASDMFRVRVRLVNRRDGAILWAESYEGDLLVSQLVQAQIDIADEVATALGQVDGVIFHAEARNHRQSPPENWAAYSCILSFHTFRATLDASRIPDVQACLEATVQRFPGYATAWALLALVEIDALRSQFPYDAALTERAVARVLDHARRAVALNPFDVRGLQAEMLALYYDRQFEAGRKVGERALSLNPNDIELIAEYGQRLALSGDWQEGCRLLRTARERRPVRSVYQNNLAILCAYFEGDLAKAMSLIGTVSPESHPLTMLIAAVIYGEADDREGAGRIRALLQQAAPSLLTDARIEVEARLGRPDDVDRVMQSLQKAGFTDTVAKDQL